jgi:arginyl-tRNA synthetase
MENRTVSEAEAKETAKMVGLAALKYGDLSNQAAKDYIFDIDRFISFEGNTGPYILYTIVRIKSILAKYEALDKKYEGEAAVLAPANDAEKALMLLLARFNDVLETAWNEIAPHKICQFIYELSNAFNSFYHDTRILAQEDLAQQASWITLITLVKDVLNTCIGLLGFEAPERM